jgi:hypothetical protein
MKVFLLHPDRDIDLDEPLPPTEAALTQDLELEILLAAMAAGDTFLHNVARRVVLRSLTDPDAITYRQRVLTDCLAHPHIVRRMYDVAVEILQSERKVHTYWFRDSPDAILSRAIQVLELLAGGLRQLRQLVNQHAAEFRSDGFTRLFAMLDRELDDEYLDSIDAHLDALRFRDGVLISAELGTGLKAVRYLLHQPPARNWLQRLTGRDGRPGYSFQIPDRDEGGFRALSELRGRGVNPVANALAQSADHVLSFVAMLRTELGFYLGCLHLYDRLAALGEPACLPDPRPAGTMLFTCRGLYDPCLSLRVGDRVVGNDIDAEGKRLVMITGANQGGKSTFLRSVGVARLMMQAGMFAPARSLTATVCHGLFTHFKREEDESMTSGKLDEELARMSEIADQITPQSLLLCNESFASTNEREGSEIARQIIRAVTDAGATVFFVTHLFDLAHSLHREQLDTALFLVAEREPDGRRTFRLVEGEPSPTSYGPDSYRRIFGDSTTTAARLAAAEGTYVPR